MKILTARKNISDLSSRQSRPVIMKISTCHLKSLDMKILTCYYENLELLSWKSQPFIIKLRSAIMNINLNFYLDGAPYKNFIKQTISQLFFNHLVKDSFFTDEKRL